MYSANYTVTYVKNEKINCGIINFEEADSKIIKANRIVGGWVAEEHSFPFMVAVERMTSSSKVFACGATLIQPEPGNGTKIVLTAAHCIFSQIMNGAVHPQNFVVSAGVHNLYKQNEENRQTVRVRNYLCHDFSFSTQRNDIALLFLDDWIIYNKHILPICTAKADQAVPDDSICFTAGWGKTESAHLSDVLRIVDVSFYPEQTCITNPSSPFDKETMICTAGYPKKSGTCMGDSGGPLVCFVDEKFVQFGIVSWGYRCGDIAVFTKLSQFSSWLEESMNDKENYNLPVPNLRVFPSKAHAMQQMKASFPLLWTFQKPAHLIPNNPSISKILYVKAMTFIIIISVMLFEISSVMCVEIDCGLITVEHSPKNRNKNSNRIIGGWTAEPHTFPWIVKLEKIQNFQRKFLCGGTLIQPKKSNGTNFVLTAAHCTGSFILNQHFRPHELLATVGIHDELKINNPHERTVRVKSYLHNNYNEKTLKNDIALLLLDEWITYNDHVLPICLAKYEEQPPTNSICFSAGWGKTEDNLPSKELRIVDLVFQSKEVCMLYPHSLFDWKTMLCTIGQNNKSGVCLGDSGGPLVCYYKNKFVQFGVVSWGYQCGEISVFTKVSHYFYWLKNIMENPENFPNIIHQPMSITNIPIASYPTVFSPFPSLWKLLEMLTNHVLKYTEQSITVFVPFDQTTVLRRKSSVADRLLEFLEYKLPHIRKSKLPHSNTLFRKHSKVYFSLSRSMSMLNESAKFIKHRNDNLIKSPEDKRSYRGLELNNGLKVLLISDPTADKAAASLDVSAGHMMDPSNMPGLAHFCEHMLFLGTKKYPKDNEYQSYLVAHGGNSNAYTSTDHTNYHFDVTPEFLGGALDRFAQFFIEPLFTVDATEREVNAVDSEMRGNLQSDSWRDHQLERHLSNPKHDYNKFGTGTRKTLLDDVLSRGEDPREALLKFYQNHYSANLMALCIMGKESLDELQAAYVPTFASIENKKLEKIVWKEHPYTAKELGFRVDVVPVKDLRSINFCFPLPDLQEHYSSNPGHYIGHLLGHEASGSLLSELKKHGWVNTLTAGPRTAARGFWFFSIDVEVTESGLEHVDDIAQLVFEYINLVRTEGVQEWIHRECEDLNKIEFRFKDKEQPMNLTTYLASALQLYPMQDVMFGPYRMDQYRPELVHMVLDQLRPDNMLMTVTSKSFENVVDSVEPWYGTSYRKQPLDGQFLQRCNCSSGGSSKFKLPDRNAFIPTDFSLADCAQQTKLPRLLTGEQGDEDPMARVWYKKDDEFLTPKTVVRLLLRSPLTNSSPGRMVEAQLYSELVFDALNEHAYNAMLAGLKYSVVSTTIGMQVSVSGYSEKLPVLLSSIIDKMLSLEVEPSTFDRLKERFIRRLRNFDMESPYQHSMYYSTLLLSDRIWSKKELLREAIGLKIEMIDEFKRELFSEMHIEALVFGNASEKNARDILSQTRSAILQKMQPKPLLASQVVRNREVKLPKGKTFVFEAQNTVHPNSAIEMILQVGLQESRLNMLLELLVQILNEPCFHQLRTVEQLGYIVFGGLRRANDTQALHIIVQSEKSPAYLDERIEAFLSQLLEDIKNMPSEEFEEHRAALTAKRLEKPKKLVSAAAKVWSEISSEQYNFERDQKEVDILKTITKEELIDFYKVEKIKNLSDFKNNLPLFPRIKPEMEVPQIGVLPTEGI
ncbi:Insulin-degrading enzyme [Trichinella pseudospiralis]|uniref:Insulin-degrading enzyme n=1 Tax=Trichinella pseudospiralis TaxID=6337 RepID=A0A0V1EUV7_TRIPS|nr:Insulin-degrading enzyme [Trichinella pseudospiralis]